METRRVHEMDWLRVLAFGLLMVYHTGMLFVGWDFHLINRDRLPELAPAMVFVNQWRLPLLFAISGAGTWFALGRRGLPRFAAERTLRLFLPLLFGMFFIIPPQIYVERVVKGMTNASYPAFQVSVFEMVPYPEGGAFSWHHLWFVLYLFFFSLVSLPIFAALRTSRGEAYLTRLRAWLSGSVNRVVLPALLLAAAHVTLDARWPETHGFFDDPGALIRYVLLFWLGFLSFGSAAIRERLKRDRAVFLIAAAACFLAQRLLVAQWDEAWRSVLVPCYQILRGCYCWLAITAVFGYSARYLNKPSRFLTYANEAVYPFYILHQSVMMVVYYFVTPTDWGPWFRFGVVLTGMFLITGLLYEGIIRRTPFLRPLFGLRLESRLLERGASMGTRGSGHMVRSRT